MIRSLVGGAIYGLVGHSALLSSDRVRKFNKSAVVGGESVAQDNLGDGAGEVGFGQEKG